MVYYSENIVTPHGNIKGYLDIEAGEIKAIHKTYQGSFIDYTDQVIFPGFLDIHVHGWGRGSFMANNDANAIRLMGEDMVKEGVTGFLATTIASSIESTKKSIQAGNEVYKEVSVGSEFLGIHLEGPFMNPLHKGMQPEEYCIAADLNIMKELYDTQEDTSLIKLMTMAPERGEAKEVLKFCKERGIQISIGHSDATFDVISELKEYGIGGVTHMFSGMRGLHHRELGVVGTALYYDDLMCEFAKQTGMTVRHEAFDIAYRLKGANGIFMTTDCAGLGAKLGTSYHYVRKITFSNDGEVFSIKHDDGREESFKISDYSQLRKLEMSYIDSVQNMLKHTPMTYGDIAKICSYNPAKYIGLEESKGRILMGMDADLTIVNKDFTLAETVVGGERKFVSASK